MRNARAKDYIRRLSDQAKLWPITLAEFSCVNVLGLGTQAINISSPVTVLCGPNGVGKSTLLNALWAAVDVAAARKRELNQLKLGGGEVRVRINFRGEPRELRSDLSQDATEQTDALFSEVVHLDTSADVVRLQKLWIAEKNEHYEADETETVDAEEITEGEAVRELTSKEVETINYVTGRRYTKILVSEIELSSEIVPFFEVSIDVTTYDSRTMGSGEFAAFLMWWKLDRTKDNSLLLLEEPESFLSPNARKAFIMVLLQYAFNKKMCIVLTSHSSEIILPLPPEACLFFKRDANKNCTIVDRPVPALLETIGIRPKTDIIMFVEDNAARTFGQFILDRYDPFIAQRTEFKVTTGDGDIFNVLAATDSKYGSVSIIGLLDGDARPKTPSGVKKKAVYLPGEQPIEDIFRALLEPILDAFGQEISRPRLSDMMFPYAGAEKHDWYEELSRNTGYNKSQIFLFAFNRWISSPDNEAACVETFHQIQRILGVPDEHLYKLGEQTSSAIVEAVVVNQGV